MERIVEALLFASGEPVSLERLREVLAHVQGEAPSGRELETVIKRLNASYEAEGRAFRIYRWGEGYQMGTLPEFAPYLEALLTERRERRLSRALLETLAVVAYRQPVSKPEVDTIRGVDSGYALARLLEYGFIEVRGRADAPGRPLLYGTTPRFLEAFGLASLEDLPRPRELEELMADPRFQRERARLLAFQPDTTEHPPETDGG